MTQELRALVIAAASIGFFHTLLGPDHYLPFIMMSWARRWSNAKTAVITFLCALGHIGSSVVLGLSGVALGLAVESLTGAESIRGRIAAWLLIAFGLAYLIWGIRHSYRNRPHQHPHSHAAGEGRSHVHPHSHFGGHTHVHDVESMKSLTPWILFTIFVFGPCEPLIPFLMYPAAKGSLFGLLLVTAVFGATTTATMLAAVFLGKTGVNFLPLRGLQRYTHAVAGATILLCGLAIEFLGL
ncbi:MAG: sulfite exporter TauE/SafE family protein [Sedimentisphaerales bacterium]|nr:sulfite exporter TauE/SafE family protein [Sedimentisphaerales bacterium]